MTFFCAPWLTALLNEIYDIYLVTLTNHDSPTPLASTQFVNDPFNDMFAMTETSTVSSRTLPIPVRLMGLKLALQINSVLYVKKRYILTVHMEV